MNRVFGQKGVLVVVSVLSINLKEIKGIKGIHLMIVGAEKTIPEIAQKADLLPRPEFEISI